MSVRALFESMACSRADCHAATSAAAGLSLDGDASLYGTLVESPACLAPNLVLVSRVGGDQGLRESWLWQKLTAKADASGAIDDPQSEPEWGPPGICGQMAWAPYGTRMAPYPPDPQTLTVLVPSDQELAAVRDWICMGAPGI